MGWTTPNKGNRADIMRDNYNDVKHSLDMIAYAEADTAQWFLIRHRKTGTVYGLVIIYQGTSYKDMTTDIGPYRYDVPKSWIDQIDDVGYTSGWKVEARAYRGALCQRQGQKRSVPIHRQ